MILTFHKILSACEEGNAEAWRAFLSDYTPVVFQLLGTHFGFEPPEQEKVWRQVLSELAANNFERLRSFEHQAEREFLVQLRAYLFDRSMPPLDPSNDSSQAPRPTVETVTALLKGLPLNDQEILFLKLCGYSDASIEQFLRITPAVAQRGLERLRQGYAAVLGRAEDLCLWPAAWGQVMQSARAGRKGECLSVRQFIRCQEGGFSWHEKEPVENHVSECLHCLDCWTALREIWYWRRQAKPRPLAELDSLLSSLPLAAESKAPKSFLHRIFG